MPIRQPTRLTSGSANDQLLYFTSSSLTADNQTVVFLSDRDSAIPKADDPDANVNLYALDRRTGEVRRLTDHRDGYLRSYVYFEGHPGCGFGLASPSLHSGSGDVYHLHGRELRCVNAHTGLARTLSVLPADHVTGFTHVSDDNTRVCVPTIHESAFRDISKIDATVQELGLVGHVRVFDTQTGTEVTDIEVDRGWVTHVQFQPGRSDVVLFNHEWPADAGIRRVWLWDGTNIHRMRDEGPGDDRSAPRYRADWVCHEVWSRDGRSIVYHGTYANGADRFAGRSFVGRVDPDGCNRVEIPFPAGFRRYGHFTLGPTAGLLVGDGYAEYGPDGRPRTDPTHASDASSYGGEWISRLDVDWDARTIDWTALCRHDSSWTSQDAHPHPIVNDAGSEAFFTSDRTGNRAVYVVPFDKHPDQKSPATSYRPG